MSTFFTAIQVLCYGAGIVSASLNIASLVRRWRTMEVTFDCDRPGDWP